MTRSPLRCSTSIIRSSALVQASSSLSISCTRAWPRSSPSTKFYFRHGFWMQLVEQAVSQGAMALHTMHQQHQLQVLRQQLETNTIRTSKETESARITFMQAQVADARQDTAQAQDMRWIIACSVMQCSRRPIRCRRCSTSLSSCGLVVCHRRTTC